MPLLGMVGNTAAEVDTLFSQFDPDGSTEKDYKISDVVEVLVKGKYYAAVVTRVRRDGCIGVKYRVSPGLRKSTESGIDLARVRWPSDEDESEGGPPAPMLRVYTL